jgi:hypothetical protein
MTECKILTHAEARQPKILTAYFSVVVTSKFLNLEDIAALSQVCKTTKSNILKPLISQQQQIYKNANALLKVYLSREVATLNTSAETILEKLPFITELFNERADLDLEHLMRRFRSYEGKGMAKRICDAAEEQLRTHLIEKNQAFTNANSLEGSFVIAVTMWVYH